MASANYTSIRQFSGYEKIIIRFKVYILNFQCGPQQPGLFPEGGAWGGTDHPWNLIGRPKCHPFICKYDWLSA